MKIGKIDKEQPHENVNVVEEMKIYGLTFKNQENQNPSTTW